MCRFYLKELSPHFKLYMSPINIDPGKPALPISYPFPYSIYLAKTQGHFTTLGLAEDTWALNERVLDEDAFIRQAYLIHGERETMFFDALEKTIEAWWHVFLTSRIEWGTCFGAISKRITRPMPART